MSYQQPPVKTPASSAKPSIGPLPIAALILGILSFVLSLLAAIPAIICGIVAFRRILREPGRYAGMGLALAGIICGIIGPLLMIMAISAALAMGKAQQRSRAAVCMARLQSIGIATHTYLAEYGYNFPANGVLFPIPGGSNAAPTLGYGNGEIDRQRWDLPYGQLWPYLAMNRNAYLCPGDNLVRPSSGQLVRGDDGTISYVGGPPVSNGKGYWSYSTNTMLNSEGRFRDNFRPAAASAPAKPWADPLKAINIARDADFVFFVEESVQSRFDDEVFDPPAYNGLLAHRADTLTDRHNNGGHVSFGDGHCEWFKAVDFNARPAGKFDHAAAIKIPYTRMFFPDSGAFVTTLAPSTLPEAR